MAADCLRHFWLAWARAKLFQLVSLGDAVTLSLSLIKRIGLLRSRSAACLTRDFSVIIVVTNQYGSGARVFSGASIVTSVPGQNLLVEGFDEDGEYFTDERSGKRKHV
jgi:hypothetical protein